MVIHIATAPDTPALALALALVRVRAVVTTTITEMKTISLKISLVVCYPISSRARAVRL